MSFQPPFPHLDHQTRMQMESWLAYTQPDLDATAMAMPNPIAIPQFETGYPTYAYPYNAVPSSFPSPQPSVPLSRSSEIDLYEYLRDASLPLGLPHARTWPAYFWHDAHSDHASTPTLSSAGRSASPDETRFDTIETRSPESMLVDEPLGMVSNAEPSSSLTTRPGEENVTPATEIDALMSAIQANHSTTTTASSLSSHPSTSAPSGGEKPRKHPCPYPSCSKSFTQKTHLEIHLRAHSGEKPFPCREPSCGQRFSQLGNLRTHERRHTGERPFACEIEGCGKRFAQRGNLRGHRLGVHGLVVSSLTEQEGGSPQQTLAPISCEGGITGRGKSGRGRFQCRLDECSANGEGKWFTQLGNLKSHQNKFHQATLRDLRERFAQVVNIESRGGNAVEAMGQQERELWEYFQGLYRNCNKGIKGRGKGRRVGVVTTPATSMSAVQDQRSQTEFTPEQLEWWSQQEQQYQHQNWQEEHSGMTMGMCRSNTVDLTLED